MTVKLEKIRIGTRGSPLALKQTEMVQAAIARVAPGLEMEVVVIKTSGDWRPEQGEARLIEEQGGKGQFAKEIEEALLAGSIDIAVHSMKDMESDLPEGLVIDHMLPREDARDVLLFNGLDKIGNLADLPQGARVGTASVRRMAFLRALRPDLQISTLRGNVQTRIDKMRSGKVDVIVLAVAGLKRLELEDEIARGLVLEPDEFLPPAGQGGVGIERRKNDKKLLAILGQISCESTVFCVFAERAALRVLSGSCHTPIGAYGTIKDGRMYLRLTLAALDGSALYTEEIQQEIRSAQEAEKLGELLGKKLKARVPENLLQQKAA